MIDSRGDLPAERKEKKAIHSNHRRRAKKGVILSSLITIKEGEAATRSYGGKPPPSRDSLLKGIESRISLNIKEKGESQIYQEAWKKGAIACFRMQSEQFILVSSEEEKRS